jgi:hypothetical protein
MCTIDLIKQQLDSFETKSRGPLHSGFAQARAPE